VCSFVAGMGILSGRAGRRKGRAPVGEAWLVEGRMRKVTPARRRKVC